MPDTLTASAGPGPMLPDPADLRPRPAGSRAVTHRAGGVDPSSTAGSTSTDCARRRVAPEDALQMATERDGFVWLGLYEPTEAELGAIAARYGLHPLAVEDAVYAHQRPKLDQYDDAIFMVLKTATYVEHEHLTATSEVVDTGEVMVFLGAALRDHRPPRAARRAEGPAQPAGGAARPALPGARRGAVRRRRPGRRHLRRGRDRRRGGRRRARGVGVQPGTHRRHRPALPAQAGADVAAAGGLAAGGAAAEAGRADIDGIPDGIRSYFRDVLDHAIRVRDQVASLDELLTSILQASLARTSLADNEDTRKISAWAAHDRRPDADHRRVRHELRPTCRS